MWRKGPGDGKEEARETARSVMEGRRERACPKSTSPSSPPGDPGKGSPGVLSLSHGSQPRSPRTAPSKKLSQIFSVLPLCQHSFPSSFLHLKPWVPLRELVCHCMLCWFVNKV